MSGNCFNMDTADYDGGAGEGKQCDVLSKTESVLHIKKIEEQLETTESRCKTLTEKLMNLKKKCEEKKHAEVKLNTHTESDKVQLKRANTDLSNEYAAPPRQNPKNIGTDTSGAAIRTINSILTGISVSVNHSAKFDRMKDEEASNATTDNYNEYGDSYALDTRTDIYPRKRTSSTSRRSLELKRENIQSDRIIVDRKTSNIKFKVKLKNSKEIKKVVKSKKRGTATPDSRRKPPWTSKTLASYPSNEFKLNKSEESTQTRKRKRLGKRVSKASKISITQSNHMRSKSTEDVYSDNLVELYHNIAVRESDSDESQQRKSASKNPIPKSQSVIQHQPLRHPLQIPTAQTTHALTPIIEQAPSESILHSQSANPSYFDTYKNYQLPTFSSRMRQAAKRYLSTFSFRSIPFCAATSTTQSHNIGLNIQQVMSIIKMKQPLSGISPTLVHNINLAAGKLQSRPFSTLVSTISSRIGFVFGDEQSQIKTNTTQILVLVLHLKYGRSQCPLVEDLDYGHLQEMAREVQDVPYHEMFIEEVPIENENIITGSAGDNEQTSVWTMPVTKEKCCTCILQPEVPFQQMFHKFHATSDTNSTCPPKLKLDQIPSQIAKKQYTRRWVRGGGQHQQQQSDLQGEEQNQKTTEELRGRQKTLKEVLQNLHNDFDCLNSKYESMAQRLDHGTLENKPETIQELLRLEKDLNNKEEEIKMVMNLYTEVVALQNQVKKLQATSINDEHDEPKALLHLTQLLKQIQNYQLRYKTVK